MRDQVRATTDERDVATTRDRAIVQTKLEVGRADDPLEREADQTASIVMQRLSAASQGDEELEAGNSARQVLRRRADGDAIGPRGGSVDVSTERAITASSGAALAPSVRSPMESAFGADFSSVKIHTGPAADDLNAHLSAKAFTSGSDDEAYASLYG